MNLHPTQVIRLLMRTEKSTRLLERNNQVAFLVAPAATKQQIKAAVESIFKVTVDSVNTSNRQGKSKRFGNRIGRRVHNKCAFVSLAEGQSINVSEGE